MYAACTVSMVRVVIIWLIKLQLHIWSKISKKDIEFSNLLFTWVLKQVWKKFWATKYWGSHRFKEVLAQSTRVTFWTRKPVVFSLIPIVFHSRKYKKPCYSRYECSPKNVKYIRYSNPPVSGKLMATLMYAWPYYLTKYIQEGASTDVQHPTVKRLGIYILRFFLKHSSVGRWHGNTVM